MVISTWVHSLRIFLDKKYIYTNFSNRANLKEEWKEYYFETHDDIKLSIGEIDYINCIGNDKLFRAISALNNDTDYMPKLEEYTDLKKATLEELMKKFEL